MHCTLCFNTNILSNLLKEAVTHKPLSVTLYGRPPPLNDQLVRVAPDGLLLAGKVVQVAQGHQGALNRLVGLGGSSGSD